MIAPDAGGATPRAMTIPLRDARPADVPRLGDVARAAKAHWGYPAGWLEAWRTELTITPADLARWTVRVADDGAGTALGFAATAVASPRWELGHLWVHPAAMGRGIGRLLLRDALRSAHAAGAVGLAIVSDPHAAAFYLRCGARPAGDVPAPMPGAPDRTLPRLWLDAAAG